MDNANCLNNTTGRIGGDVGTAALGAGATSPTITSANWTVTSGQHTVSFCTDVGKVISESDEGNNCSTLSFSTSGPTFREVPP